MLQRMEMDEHVPLGEQLAEEVGPVTLINTFKVAPEDADALLDAWAADAAYLKTKPGFISTQLYRGIAGSGVFVNQAVWESVAAFRNAFGIRSSRRPSPAIPTPRWPHRICSRSWPCPASARTARSSTPTALNPATITSMSSTSPEGARRPSSRGPEKRSRLAAYGDLLS
jgi:quinol monooxygenase YgiN